MEQSVPLLKPTGSGTPDSSTPSFSVTILLIVISTGLWFGVLQACLLTVVQGGMSNRMNLSLPVPAAVVLDLPFWRWFHSYWWILVFSFPLATGLFAFVTFLIRHGIRSKLAHWAWGLSLTITPVLLLQLLWLTIWQCSILISRDGIIYVRNHGS